MDNKAARSYFNGAGCKREPRNITVREWIADVADEESEKAGKLWRDVISVVHPAIQPDKLNVSAETRETIFNIIFGTLYLEYDTQKPFVPQLEKKFEIIKRFLEVREI
jgi:hypothetical protein